MMNLKKTFIFYLVILLGCIASVSYASSSPKEQMKTSVDAIINILKNKELDQKTRRKKIRLIIKKRFDFWAMSQRTMATNWKKLSSREKKRFVTLFTRFLVNNYMERIEAYTDETIEYPKEKIKENRAMVNTVILTKSVEIPVMYKMRLKKGEWLVYDVVIEGISLIKNYRSSYKEIVKKKGLGELMTMLEKKIKDNQTKY